MLNKKTLLVNSILLSIWLAGYSHYAHSDGWDVLGTVFFEFCYPAFMFINFFMMFVMFLKRRKSNGLAYGLNLVLAILVLCAAKYPNGSPLVKDVFYLIGEFCRLVFDLLRAPFVGPVLLLLVCFFIIFRLLRRPGRLQSSSQKTHSFKKNSTLAILFLISSLINICFLAVDDFPAAVAQTVLAASEKFQQDLLTTVGPMILPAKVPLSESTQKIADSQRKADLDAKEEARIRKNKEEREAFDREFRLKQEKRQAEIEAEKLQREKKAQEAQELLAQKAKAVRTRMSIDPETMCLQRPNIDSWPSNHEDVCQSTDDHTICVRRWFFASGYTRMIETTDQGVRNGLYIECEDGGILKSKQMYKNGALIDG